ncbi:unnamed protein product [Caenorhabditis auriculariae]|uniref:Leishmanolysin-like peptidase n=1 Tax=Caenorhabditis auriculariae TaxID=2777116 RepID=A0A8S1HSQ1_9PELO|nr:unnamed protein product [Caenorhabditis auriculariae]
MKPSGIDPILRDFLGLSLLCTLGAAFELYIDPKNYQYTGTPVDKSTVAERPWEPIRFKFFLEESMFTKVDTARREILKRVIKESFQFYSDSNLRVQRDPNGLALYKNKHNNQYNKGYDVNGLLVKFPESVNFFKADMVFLIHFTDDPNFAGSGSAAATLGFDVNTYRPNVGIVLITANTYTILETMAYRKGYEASVGVLRHEIGHALGIGRLVMQYSTYAEYALNSTREKIYPETEDADNAKELFMGLSFPTILAETRKHFECPDLKFIELENGGGTGSRGGEPLPPYFDKDPCLRAKSCKMSDYKGQLHVIINFLRS